MGARTCTDTVQRVHSPSFDDVPTPDEVAAMVEANQAIAEGRTHEFRTIDEILPGFRDSESSDDLGGAASP